MRLDLRNLAFGTVGSSRGCRIPQGRFIRVEDRQQHAGKSKGGNDIGGIGSQLPDMINMIDCLEKAGMGV